VRESAWQTRAAEVARHDWLKEHSGGGNRLLLTTMTLRAGLQFICMLPEALTAGPIAHPRAADAASWQMKWFDAAFL